MQSKKKVFLADACTYAVFYVYVLLMTAVCFDLKYSLRNLEICFLLLLGVYVISVLWGCVDML